MSVTGTAWDVLTSYSNEFTCYSAAVATWLAADREDWQPLVSTGLWLKITNADEGLFGFGYFRPTLRTELGLERTGSDDPAAAVEGVLAELGRSGRVIVAGDGFRLPWHVAHQRIHAPHWYALTQATDGLEVTDPFACRNELGIQRVARQPVSHTSLPELLRALPGDDPVHRLRELLALGDVTAASCDHHFQWFVRQAVVDARGPIGDDGPDAVLALARHFRQRGADPSAYAQVDDIWSIARHRAFMCRYVRERSLVEGDELLAAWADEHAAPLAKRWGHMAPLLMQATLSLRAQRAPSTSVPDTLERIAELERCAAIAYPGDSSTI